MNSAKRLSVVSALLICTAGLAGCAAPNTGASTPIQTVSQAPDACFMNSDVTNVNVLDEKTAYVSTRRGYVYRLDAPGGCFDQRGGTVSVGGPGAGTCVGSQAKVTGGGSFRFPSEQCFAQVTGPYTDSRETGLWSRTVAR